MGGRRDITRSYVHNHTNGDRISALRPFHLGRSRLRVDLFDPLPPMLRVGGGTALVLHGRCTHEFSSIQNLSLVVPGLDRRVPVESGRDGASRRAREWWTILPLEPISGPLDVPLELHAELGGGDVAVAPIGSIELLPDDSHGLADVRDGEDGLITICMATWNPPLDLFERQIESIRAQTDTNWVCVISDDASSPAGRAMIEKSVRDDPRFFVSSSRTRRGFYRNFERALRLIPRETSYISLCDQDDRWYPDKLAALRSRFDANTMLVYSDMRVVKRDGSVISDTYWRYRRNNYTDFVSLLIGNTVSGAAAMCRRELLASALPFPPSVGRSFHDHWLAVMALALGSIDYVDRPLLDYVQHEESAFGYSDANAGWGSGSSRIVDFGHRLSRLASRLMRPNARARYFDDYCRAAGIATVVKLRGGTRLTARRTRELDRIIDSDRTIRGTAWLGLRSLVSSLRGNSAMGVDRSMFFGLLWSRIARWGIRRGARGQRAEHSSVALEPVATIARLPRTPGQVERHPPDGFVLTGRVAPGAADLEEPIAELDTETYSDAQANGEPR